MAETRDEKFEESSSSHGTEKVSQDEDALFKAQLVSFMETFQQLAKHPKMQELLQASKTPTQTQKASSQSLQSSKQSKAPFEIVEGGKKVPPILQTKDKIFEADKYVQNTDEAYRKIKLALEKTQSKQKKAADRHCRELVFSLGDWVLLRFEKARLRKMKGKERLFSKLGMRYYGPFQVCDKISDVAYRLKLPEGWKIHNAFHVSLLRSFVGDVPEDMVPEEQPEVEELDEILVPE
ncbi:hypothetical protein L7F22_059473 [Adiantum nelumboides]|nr:hypothetical protein [Adiantum nelumboides]